MNEKLNNLLDTSVDCLKQVYKDMSARSEEQRKLAEARQQEEQARIEKAYYCSLYPLTLTNEQYRLLESDFYYSRAAIIPLDLAQSVDITKHLINQAKMNNDIALLKAIREEASTSLNASFDFARFLHKQLYDSFIHAYYPHLTYAEVTPVGCSVIIREDFYGFVYSFALDRQIVYDAVKKNFKRFKNTQYCQQLFNQYKITSAKISFDTQNYNLIIFLK